MGQDRRQFLRTLGTAALAASCRRPPRADGPAGAQSPLGIQLYTVRRQAAADRDTSLSRIAAIGYREVELAGYYNHSATEFRALLDRHGLAAPSGHIAIELIENAPAKTFADAHAVGHQWITVPSLPRGRHETADDQMDIYWAVSGGADPVALLARFPGRFKMLHVKDGRPPYSDASQTDVGAGTIDFAPIFAHAAAIEHRFVESDSAADPFAFAKNSFDYLRRT